LRATPLDERREPDLSYVKQTAESILPNLQKGHLVVLDPQRIREHGRVGAADTGVERNALSDRGGRSE